MRRAWHQRTTTTTTTTTTQEEPSAPTVSMGLWQWHGGVAGPRQCVCARGTEMR